MGPWGKGPQAVSSHFPLPAPPPKQQAQVTQSWEGLRGGHGQAAGQTPRLLSAATLGCFWPQGKSGGCPPCAVGQRSQDLPFLMLMIRLHQCSSPRDRRGKGQDGRVLGSKGAPGGVGGQSCLAGPSVPVGGGFFSSVFAAQTRGCSPIQQGLPRAFAYAMPSALVVLACPRATSQGDPS